MVVTSRPRGGSGQVLLEMLCMLAVACAMGWLFNRQSPVGIRWTTPPATAVTRASTATPPPAAGAYANETLSLTVEQVPGPMQIPQVLPIASNPFPAAAASATAARESIPRMKWSQVRPLAEAGKVVLVDGRSRKAFDYGHIPGAVWLAPGNPADVQAFVAKYPKNTIFVAYCSSETCHVSQYLAEQLVRTGGFSNVFVMPGGYAEYLVSTRPQTKANP